MKLEKLFQLAEVLKHEVEGEELEHESETYNFSGYRELRANGYYVASCCGRLFKDVASKRMHQGWCRKVSS